MKKEWTVTIGKPYPLGTSKGKEGMNFAFVLEKPCDVCFYDAATREPKITIPFPEKYRQGNILSMEIHIPKGEWLYQIVCDGKILSNPYMKNVQGHEEYATVVDEDTLFDKITDMEYDWEKDQEPRIPYEESIVYCLHVRGFTKHASSGVKFKGTFAGIIEKITYLKELGITTLEVMPVYEFLEKEASKREKSIPQMYREESQIPLNYWGYKEGFYYAPKANYAGGEDACKELRDLIKTLHLNQMEIVLQFYFPSSVKKGSILDILRYWKMEYHVDGFHLKGENLPIETIAEEPLFSYTKLWYYDFYVQPVYDGDKKPVVRHLAMYQDEFMIDMRRFLKGDEGMISTALRHMRHNPYPKAVVNYFSNYYSLTMQDMVSFERKHNEANGENNRDGIDYNYSWNCGAEGKSRNKAIVQLRQRQLRNAFILLFFSQGTPLLYQGDEFGNSQEGNNNPYCQDNEISWLNWKELEKNQELFEFVKSLIAIRKAHPILHMPQEMRIMDYKSCGYPDVSYHGTNAWNPETESYNRHVALMYCGKYVMKNKQTEDDFFFVTINMHWEKHDFSLPSLPKGMNWYPLLNTMNGTILEKSKPLTDQKHVVAEDRSIQIYIGR